MVNSIEDNLFINLKIVFIDYKKKKNVIHINYTIYIIYITIRHLK